MAAGRHFLASQIWAPNQTRRPIWASNTSKRVFSAQEVAFRVRKINITVFTHKIPQNPNFGDFQCISYGKRKC